jgi:hypothetical protein
VRAGAGVPSSRCVSSWVAVLARATTQAQNTGGVHMLVCHSVLKDSTQAIGCSQGWPGVRLLLTLRTVLPLLTAAVTSVR